MRTPTEWKVPIHIPAGSRPSAFRTRSRISPAALLVKVSARIPAGSTPCSSTSQAMRVVSTRVFPDPAPASTSSGSLEVRGGFALLGVQVREVERRHGSFVRMNGYGNGLRQRLNGDGFDGNCNCLRQRRIWACPSAALRVGLRAR
jgi:hypothetical protein